MATKSDPATISSIITRIGLGLACPIGAHIRRANPRDLLSTDPDTALRLSKMHRIIRRGRLYGPHVARNGADDTAGIKDPRGIYFMCLNADIAGQFELIYTPG